MDAEQDWDLSELAELLMNVEAAERFLTDEERAAYRDAQESVIRARAEAQRWGATHWISG